jgi:hypothetical protein
MATNSKNVSKHLVYTGLCKNKGKCRKDPYACYLYREEAEEGPVEQQTQWSLVQGGLRVLKAFRRT